MKKSIATLLCIASFSLFGAPVPSYQGATNIARAVVNQTVTKQFVENLGIEAGGGGIKPLPRYLHFLRFDGSYESDAAWFYANNAPVTGACSVVRDGNAFHRNYDWFFTDAMTFVGETTHGINRLASLAVMSVGTNLTDKTAKSSEGSRYFRCLPGMSLDGVNECHVAANINVQSGQIGWRRTGSLHCLGAVKWVLDHATNALHGASYLAANVYIPSDYPMGFHYMVADLNSTYIVENNEYHEVDGRAVMTNYRIYPMDQTGQGQERYQILLNDGDITDAWWTKAYLRTTNPAWTSDIGEDTETVFTAWESKTREEHRNEVTASGNRWWQTVHTSMYDLKNLTLRIAVQEEDVWYDFSIASPERVRRVIEEVRDRFYDAALDVTWKRTVNDGRIFYDIECIGDGTGN